MFSALLSSYDAQALLIYSEAAPHLLVRLSFSLFSSLEGTGVAEPDLALLELELAAEVDPLDLEPDLDLERDLDLNETESRNHFCKCI